MGSWPRARLKNSSDYAGKHTPKRMLELAELDNAAVKELVEGD